MEEDPDAAAPISNEQLAKGYEWHFVGAKNPDEETKNDKGMKFLIYKSKKYAIACERKFEIDKLGIVIGFSSKGCF